VSLARSAGSRASSVRRPAGSIRSTTTWRDRGAAGSRRCVITLSPATVSGTSTPSRVPGHGSAPRPGTARTTRSGVPIENTSRPSLVQPATRDATTLATTGASASARASPICTLIRSLPRIISTVPAAAEPRP
jgi:hypothetical protein